MMNDKPKARAKLTHLNGTRSLVDDESGGGLYWQALSKHGDQTMYRYVGFDVLNGQAMSHFRAEGAPAREHQKRPHGIDSPIALRMMLEAEDRERVALANGRDVDEVKKEFAMSKVIAEETDALVKKLQQFPAMKLGPMEPNEDIKLDEMVAEHIAKHPGGALESYLLPKTCDGTLFGIMREEHSVRLSQQSYQGPRRAVLSDRSMQCSAIPGVVYQVWNRSDQDAVLIVARREDGRGRMLSIPGQVWRQLQSNTNPPPGEVALTDDDLESILCDRGHQCYRITKAFSFSDAAEEYHELKESLFRTDPDVLAHVRKQMDVTDTTGWRRMQTGLDLAWERSGAGSTLVGYEPESGWMRRAAHRTSDIIDLRRKNEALK